MLYFLIMFVAGIVMGTVRQLWLVPQIGLSMSLLVEVPIMLALAAFVAAILLRRDARRFSQSEQLTIGAVALALLLAGEQLLALAISGASLLMIWGSYPPLAFGANMVGLLGFMLMPLCLGKYLASSQSDSDFSVSNERIG
ncbi:MAG: hypothetical protein U5J78_02770 [Parasphingorhabdus sp.]|nr:hypothetical protein [Parasphingorhabdus sp.]